MNLFYRKSAWFTRKYASYSQIKYLLSRLKHDGSNYIKTSTVVGHRRQLLFDSNQIHVRFFRNDHNDLEGDEDFNDDVDFMPYDEVLQQQSVRSLLYPNSEDPLILKLNDCASIHEVFSFVKENAEQMGHQHITQSILILWDLQKMFFYAHQLNRMVNSAEIQDYVQQLTNHLEFHKLLEITRRNLKDFDAEELACVLLYLNKMGLNVKNDLLQLLIAELQSRLGHGISLSALSRFIVTVLSEYNLGALLSVQDAIPIIIKELRKCESAEDLKLITICLNHLHVIIRNDLLDEYKLKVKELIDREIVTSKNYRTLLKIVMFLSYPRWSDRNTILVSEIMLLLKNNLHLLGILDFFITYEALYKNHEPGELLTEMQRCASRTLHRLEEESNLPSEIKLKLLSCVVCFSSPLHRPEYEKIIAKIVGDPLTKYSMFDFLRILTFIKPSDAKLCEAFWDNVLKTVEEQHIYEDTDVLLKLCQKYMNYTSDVQHRHRKFEKKMMEWLDNEFKNGIIDLIPSKLSMAAAFVFAYGNDRDLANHILEKLSENWEQLNHIDCLYISKGLRSVFDLTKNPIMTNQHINTINKILDTSIREKLIMQGDNVKINFLVKSCIYRRRFNRELINNLLSNLKSDQKLSSNLIRNIVFSLQTTNSLLPNIIDGIAEYVINYRDNLLGFNAEKVMYLCYHLGYVPKRSQELFQVITDVIFRDQERISGLSYIQAALSLAFFNKLSDSFIKQIFNVTFLEKLDAELATCYFRDVYPIRVRHSMMQLNRAVCLDYPQSSVPWFHQKYSEQLQSRERKETRRDSETVSKIRTYLTKIVEDPTYLLQDLKTAYGYHVDFCVNFDNSGRLLKAEEDGTRTAILLMNPKAYTNINVQLRGQYQLKRRHLEILGYKVLAVNMNAWNSLIYGEEKMDFLNKLIWPSDSVEKSSVIKR